MVIVNRLLADRSERPPDRQVGLLAERRLFLKRRWRASAEDGTEFGFDLESRLVSGCVIHQSAETDYVIWQQPELVYQITAESPEFAALAGWKIGNLHFPVQIIGSFIRVTHDPAIAQLLDREGWKYEELPVVFNPLKVMPHAS